MLRAHQMLRAKESFHIFLPVPFVNLSSCYQITKEIILILFQILAGCLLFYILVLSRKRVFMFSERIFDIATETKNSLNGENTWKR